jgi:hypothetical protein
MYIVFIGGGSLGVLLTAYLWLYEDQKSLNHLVFLFLTCLAAFPVALVSTIPCGLLTQLWLGRQFEDPLGFRFSSSMRAQSARCSCPERS